MRAFRALGSLFIVGCFVACGSSKTREGDAYGSETQFCQKWAEAACNGKVVADCAAASAATCVAKQKVFCLDLLPPHYSSKYAKQCIEKVEAAYGDAKLSAEEIAVVRKLAAPCDKLNAGPNALGESCTSSDDCNSLEGLTCITKVGESSGTCQVPKLVKGGYSCSAPDEQCDEGFYCDGQNCLARKKDGDACAAELPCQEDLLCVDSGGQGKCTPKGSTGATCADDSECQSGVCVKTASGSGKCVESVVLTPADPICQSLS